MKKTNVLQSVALVAMAVSIISAFYTTHVAHDLAEKAKIATQEKERDDDVLARQMVSSAKQQAAADPSRLVMLSATGATIFTDGASQTISVSCPDGSALTGGGYGISVGDFRAGMPTAPEFNGPVANGWQIRVVHMPSAHLGFYPYAICAVSADGKAKATAATGAQDLPQPIPQAEREAMVQKLASEAGDNTTKERVVTAGHVDAAKPCDVEGMEGSDLDGRAVLCTHRSWLAIGERAQASPAKG